MVDAIIFYVLMILGCAFDILHPKWFVWLIPLWAELGKSIAKGIRVCLKSETK